MKFFSDYHHGGAARGLFLTMKRLGHDVYFPDVDFANHGNKIINNKGAWLSCSTAKKAGVPDEYHVNDTFPWVVSKEQFFDETWDGVFITRIESEKIFKNLLKNHRDGDKIKLIASSGNDNTRFNWAWIKNFLCSDYLSFLAAPKTINKIHYSQEMGTQFASENKEFVPITQENLHTIATFINCLSSFTGPWHWHYDFSNSGGKCPHCDSNCTVQHPGVSPYGIWSELKAKLPNYHFKDYGIINTQGVIEEKNLPQTYHNCALTWHFKTYDGYGFSLLQSIAMGRLVIVPRRFHRYRTAGKYLINNLTCFEADWNTGEIFEIIKWFTGSLERANKYSEACFKASKSLFNWEFETYRIKEFLEKLQ